MLRNVGGHARQNVIAYIALFFALSGGAVAANNALKQGDAAGGDLTGTYPNPTIGVGKVDSAKVANDSLTGTDIDESTLGKVGDADTLDGIDSTGFASPPSEATHYQLSEQFTVPGDAAPGPPYPLVFGQLNCHEGDEVTGGGFNLFSWETTQVSASEPNDDFDNEPGGDDNDDDGWQVRVHNTAPTQASYVIRVRCIDLP